MRQLYNFFFKIANNLGNFRGLNEKKPNYSKVIELVIGALRAFGVAFCYRYYIIIHIKIYEHLTYLLFM